MQSETVYDAVIVGGGVAGGTAALLLRQRGCSVALLEKRPLDYYKALCTHFIQPSAVPILRRVGLDHVLEPEASTRTKASFVTSEGVIGTPAATPTMPPLRMRTTSNGACSIRRCVPAPAAKGSIC